MDETLQENIANLVTAQEAHTKQLMETIAKQRSDIFLVILHESVVKGEDGRHQEISYEFRSMNYETFIFKSAAELDALITQVVERRWELQGICMSTGVSNFQTSWGDVQRLYFWSNATKLRTEFNRRTAFSESWRWSRRQSMWFLMKPMQIPRLARFSSYDERALSD